MKKLKQIEFNEELIGKEGIVINFRKPHNTPLEVLVSKNRKIAGRDTYIIAIDKDGDCTHLHEEGRFSKGEKGDLDLIMYQEVELRVVYVNEYQEGRIGRAYSSLGDALKNAEPGYIRTIKLVEEREQRK